jgi:RNA polymerase sigma factor (sigma-70 family)
MAAAHDTIGFWLEQAGNYPVLPKAEVLRLARIVQDPNATEPARNRAINKIVRHNLKLIPGVARNLRGFAKTYNYGDCNTVDYFQMGVIGLVRAAQKFDPSRGYAFSTYAMPWIKQAMQREALKNMSSIRVPESTLRDVFELNKNYAFGCPIEMKESKRHRLTDAFLALNCNSLDAPMSSREDVDSLYECVADQHTQSDEPRFSELIDGADLADVQKELLWRRYMDNDSIDEITAKTGLSSRRVMTYLRNALASLRKHHAVTLKC